jgi:hypothetical protein
VVETDRQIDLCSEHAKRPASVPGLGWCKGPIVGIGSGVQWWKSPVTDLPSAVAASNCAHRPLKRYIRFVQLLVVVVLNSRIGFLMCRKRRNDRLDYSCASFGPTCCWMTPVPQTRLTTTR